MVLPGSGKLSLQAQLRWRITEVSVSGFCWAGGDAGGQAWVVPTCVLQQPGAPVSPAVSPQPTNEPLLVVMNVNAFFVIPARWGLVK